MAGEGGMWWLPEPQGEQWGARPGDSVHGDGSLVLRYALCGLWMKEGCRLGMWQGMGILFYWVSVGRSWWGRMKEETIIKDKINTLLDSGKNLGKMPESNEATHSRQ